MERKVTVIQDESLVKPCVDLQFIMTVLSHLLIKMCHTITKKGEKQNQHNMRKQHLSVVHIKLQMCLRT